MGTTTVYHPMTTTTFEQFTTEPITHRPGVADCGKPKNITNGKVKYTLTKLNHSAFYTCDQGYKTADTTVITCTTQGAWDGNPPTCSDVNECSGSNKCHYSAMCTNLNGSYECTCKDGYTDPEGYGGRQCDDVDECSGSNECHYSAMCTNLNGSYECTCKDGYTDPEGYGGRQCDDVNECSGSNECHYSAICTNLNGSYECTCKDGYTDPEGYGGRQCDDIDECAVVGNYFCRINWNQTRWCTNTAGSYYCGCNRGWTGKHCENDVNECDGGNLCGQNADCTNTFGSYNCNCRPGYPQGNPFYGCYSPVLLSFNSPAVIDGVRGDNEILPPVNIPGGRFPYLGQYFSLFRPSLNGFLALNYPPLYEAFGAENSTQWAEYVENHVVIAPLWTNLDSRNITGAGVWVHVFSNNTGNRSDILQIQKLVRKYSDNSEFNASVAFAVTWKHVTTHSPYMPGYMLYKYQNLSMQVIAVTDGLYTYLLFNYDQEEFSIQPNSYTPVAAGYTFPGNFTGKILANSHNFTNLKTDSNVNQAVKGRWLHDVTYITDDMRDEVGCRKFNENKTLKEWTRKQLKNSYPCPCYEQDMKEDYTFKINDSLWSNIDQYTHCYESWFFNPYDIKQRCCFRFGELRKEYPFAIGAEYRDAGYNALLETGFRQCCSAVNSRRYCHLYYDVNPPDDCSTWSPDDEADVKQALGKVMTFV
ncbi:uncharacterized protein LOC128236758 [Mya arenaria]|uniref:uncharacterized protein LOC128236758 n=1 Tax=Mya arenaria TaxID=6604 RepID=UPI0022E6BCC1|nr:uncharacterized protein LOC128236758 [Mya arenaria]